VLINISNLTAGNYLMNVTINDTSNNINWTYVNVTVLAAGADTEAPIWTDPRNFTIQANNSFLAPFNATDNVAIDQYWLNSTSIFNITSSGNLYNLTNLSTVELYWLNASVNDTSGNLNWTIFYINVTVQVITPVVITGLTADDMYILYNFERSDLAGEDMRFNYGWEI